VGFHYGYCGFLEGVAMKDILVDALLACVVDEAAFFGLSDESKVRSDTELI
jgi:hypothetical protein